MEKIGNEISDLRLECTHPNVIVSYHSDTGNYCKSDDRYWTEFRCPDCKHFWQEEKE